ncbi:hypothetical protein Enr13x_26320 [Stieleria neptunia]|uniref:Fibronectin type-III domain-containing protein n=1 Tax=Stieleria neptunia TaxID=2527979 RepID=A0A518HPK7_9BACT|nr:hypothetical protein [Stieleria neptunia]QDV42782.1 hypothetical protein Enr13x_26320 [Stieleria neptunia]
MWMLAHFNTRRKRRGARALACPRLRRVVAAAVVLIGSSTAVWDSVAMAAESEPQPRPALAFVGPELDVSREGYFTLEWTAVDGAALYRVRDRADQIAYQGVATQSFQSGLSDGVYQFYVEAIGADGEILATSAPAVATVEHWRLAPSLTLFAIGAIVVGGIAFVILRGRWIEKQIAAGDDDRASMLQTEVKSGGES